ncbi:hypothetical protein WN944_015488 [Citrus x changshan-huyou]|uniref:Uncharacterized protein n=1 Tax=Citrus x changshan-huyou TaxID=2935761 RepID=A0AAP0MBY1_9ROSI
MERTNSLPSNLNAEKLLFLELPGSDIEQLCDGVKRHGKLNQIIHDACKKLISKIPSPTLIPHPNKLVALNLRSSKSLKSLPARIFNLEFLIELDLSGCSKLKRLPDISSSNISRLYLTGTAIEELPSSFELLLRLWWLDLSDCKMLKSPPSSLLNSSAIRCFSQPIKEAALPTGPSTGVNGSSSPHKTSTGIEIDGINCTGFSPDGPVTIKTNASSAPSSVAASRMICSFDVNS